MVPSSLRRSAPALMLLGAAAVGPLACTSEPASSVGVTHPTMIEVSPADFLGARACSNEPGAVRRYVATLFDVTELSGGAGGEGNSSAAEGTDGSTEGGAGGAPSTDGSRPSACGGFQLPSSAPVSCLASVGFGFVVSGRRYCAEIDAYDTDQLEPRGSGTRQMVASDPADGEPPASSAPSVKPSWVATCREAVASASTIVPARDCDWLFPQPPAGQGGSLRIETSPLLGDLECGSEPGQVERLNVSLELDDYMNARTLEVACGEPAVYEGVPAGRLVTAYVTAFEAGSTQALAGSECHAVAKPGTAVVAACAALNQLGTLRVDLPAALESVGLGCDGSVSDVRVTAGGQERRLPPPDCSQPFDYAFAAGAASVTVSVTPTDGEPASFTCSNDIEPGRLVVAECTP